jgi:hypothetical protein
VVLVRGNVCATQSFNPSCCAAVSSQLWIGIIFSGRMIAYNWFDCDRQPQPDIINFLTSCVATEAGQ